MKCTALSSKERKKIKLHQPQNVEKDFRESISRANCHYSFYRWTKWCMILAVEKSTQFRVNRVCSLSVDIRVVVCQKNNTTFSFTFPVPSSLMHWLINSKLFHLYDRFIQVWLKAFCRLKHLKTHFRDYLRQKKNALQTKMFQRTFRKRLGK